MARTKPFFRHVQHVTGIMARAPEPERYPYHDQSTCPVGRQVKRSGDWQYYLAHPGEERIHCARCAELGAAALPGPAATAAVGSAAPEHQARTTLPWLRARR